MNSRSTFSLSLTGSGGWLVLLALSLPLLAIIAPVNHDETQYIAAAYLLDAGLVPYRDFLYLQTPYQIYLFAPLFGLFEQNAFVATRIVTGVVGATILTLVYLTLRRFRVDPGRAAICSILLWLGHSFVFSVTVVRNDAVPALLFAGAIYLVASQMSTASTARFRLWRWLTAGLLLGLATGTKISYAAPALAFVGFPVWAFLTRNAFLRETIARSASLASGLLIALFPLVFLREAAPLAFDYGNFSYHAEAPLAWYAANGLEDRLTPLAKIRDVLLTLARGPALFALAIYGWLRVRSVVGREPQAPALLLIDLLVLAGLAATVAPTPTWRQYAMPLLPPLFVGLGLVWQQAHDRGSRAPRSVLLAMRLAAIVGIGLPALQIWMAAIGAGATPLVIAREGELLAREAARDDLGGMSVSLSPEVVIASGLPLDPTFATGPFAYRTAGLLSPTEREEMNTTSPDSVIAYLEQSRPDTIVTGYENFDHVDRLGLEEPIEAFARSHRYRRLESPFGDAVFWFRRSDAEPVR